MSHAELVLLGLLSGGPASAYRLVRRVDNMRIHQWAQVAESTLYAVLRRLEGEGLLEGRQTAGDRHRQRTIYRITPRGRRHLRALIAQGIEHPAPMYSDLLVAAVFARTAGAAPELARAETAIRAVEERLARARRRKDLSPYGRVIVTFYRAVARAQREAVRALADMHDGVADESALAGVAAE